MGQGNQGKNNQQKTGTDKRQASMLPEAEQRAAAQRQQNYTQSGHRIGSFGPERNTRDSPEKSHYGQKR